MMKAIRKSDGKIIEVEPHGWRNDEVISYHSNHKDFYKPEDLDFNIVKTQPTNVISAIEKPFMRYLVICRDSTAFFTDWYSNENSWNGETMHCVINLVEGMATFDGKSWQQIDYDNL